MNPLGLVLIVLLVLLVIGGYPSFGYHHFGYYPSGLGFILLIVLLVALFR